MSPAKISAILFRPLSPDIGKPKVVIMSILCGTRGCHYQWTIIHIGISQALSMLCIFQFYVGQLMKLMAFSYASIFQTEL